MKHLIYLTFRLTFDLKVFALKCVLPHIDVAT